ncbi:hypothetical protein L1987_07660 [Smallanthus sonchifolius]|uniref:Uncharacterized protein n=1 Tax=Smallanthus sonchifolius TaxID=185202 RepID=A0ACB9K169_9ASTR|nr:hypothetical protein L1987_07660 [Smallanthus sonchifolius]
MANHLSRSIEMHHRMLFFESRYHALLSRHNDFGAYLESVMLEKRALLKEMEEKGRQLRRESEIVRLREEISGLSQQVSDKEAECVRTSSELNLLQVDLDHARGEVRTLEGAERELKARLARLDEDKQHLETLLADKEDAWALEKGVLVAERDELKASLATMSAQKETLVLENHRLSFERDWLIGTGFRLFYERLRGSREWLLLVGAVNKAAKAVGFQEGLAAGYAGSVAQVPLESVEGYDPDAFQRLCESTTTLQTSSHSLVTRLTNLTQASLDVLKTLFTGIPTPSSSVAPS